MPTLPRLLLETMVAVTAIGLSSGAHSASSSVRGADTIYRCNEGSTAHYQAEPCAGGRTLTLDAAPSPGERAQARALAQKEARWVAQAESERLRREASHRQRQQELAAAGPAGVRLRPDPWATDRPTHTAQRGESSALRSRAHPAQKGTAPKHQAGLTPVVRREWVPASRALTPSSR